MSSGSQVAISSSMPTISLDGSAAGAGGSSLVNGAPDTIAGDYAELIAAGSNFFQASGAKIFNMDAGALSTAYVGQIGRVIQGVTITAAMVQRNQQLLNAIGAYCRANGISIDVEAQLTNAPSKDWTYQWLGPAVAAGLPITAVENDDEVEVTPPLNEDLAASAQNMAAVVKQIVHYYPTVRIGQWEGQASLAVTSAWWADYNLAAKIAGLPVISYAVADTSWNAPWVTSPASWQTWLRGLSALVQSNGMQLKVLLDGINTDASDQQWTAQSEQHAAMLASLSGVTVNTLLVRTWQHALPDAILPINQPTTVGNDAAEIAAIYPLYQTGNITAQGAATLTTLPQVIVTTASTTAIQPPSLDLAAGDIAVGARVAVVLIDETGVLSAAAQGTGTVLGAGTNDLILNGTSAEIMAELKTLTLTETVNGPDSIDIEAFGVNGRLADAQIAVLALPPGHGIGAQSYSFLPQVAIQPWISSSATVASSGLMTSESFVWNSAVQNVATGAYQLIKTDSIHEPLATLGVSIVNGIVQQSMVNDESLPIGLSAFNPSAFDPAAQISSINVLNTTMTYGPRGKLQTIVDTLAPTTPTANVMGGTLPNYFVTGGSQVTQFNTVDNPNWQSSWSSQFESVTTSYGSDHQILEQMFLCGSSNHYLVLDNVFDPYTGALWEQYQTSLPPGPNATFMTGNEYITEFNTGDNPNWDYHDWGNNGQVTVTWQDYYASAVTTSPPANAGLNPDLVIGGGSFGTVSGTMTSDLFLQSDAGVTTIWQLNGASLTASGVVGLNPGRDWHIYGLGDFFGAGDTDILWQNSDGSPSIWDMKGQTIAGGGLIGLNPGPDWQIKGTGNFFGTGTSDILWQNTDGSASIWDMKGSTISGGAVIGLNPGPDWQIKGTGDLFRDGHADILWQNTNGSVAIWDMLGTATDGGGIIGLNPGPSWHIGGVGNFFGNGNTDIAWQNDDGSVAIWDMNGDTIAAGGVVGLNPGPAWHLTGTGNFFGQGNNSLEFQNDDGSIAVWGMKGTTIAEGGVIPVNPGTSWHAFGTADGMHFINGESGNQALAATAQPDEFVLSSFASGSHTITGFDVAHDIVELSRTLFSDFADVQAHAMALGGGTLIDLDPPGSHSGAVPPVSTLLLQGVSPDSLHANNFALV